MVESSVATHRKFVGTAGLYCHIALRNPPFLRRNLDRILDRHEKLLAISRGNVDGLEGDMSANERRDAGWDYPTTEMMEDLLKGQKPVLRLDALQIRKEGLARVQSGSNKRTRRSNADPEWLPDPGTDFSAPCLVTLIFIDCGTSSTKRTRTHVDTRKAVVESREATAKDRCFEVHLVEPFLIEVEKIYVTVDKGSNGTYRWKHTIPTHYRLDVEIKCEDFDDSIQILDLLHGDASQKNQNASGKNATLRATWNGLPECPSPGTLLPLRCGRHNDTIEFQYGVELSMGWSRKQDSPLAAYTKARRSACASEQEQLPTPSASDGSEKATKMHVITYVFMNERYHVMESLKCPLCAGETSARARYEYPSFDRLHWHLLTWHEHFQPQVEDEAKLSSMAVHKTVHLWLSDKLAERSIQLVEAGDEEQWIAPNRPFDQKAYLRGEDTWTRHPKIRPQGRHGSKPARSLLSAKRPPTSGTGESRTMHNKIRQPPHEVSDIIELPKAKWRVPRVPGIRFYRTVSKRPFEEDEAVSESDEDVDETWLRDRLRDDMSSLNLSKGSEDFFRDWNFVANDENFSADMLTREGVVRFTRQFQENLRDDAYRQEFMRFLTRLRTHGVIDADVFDYCNERAQQAREDLEQASGDDHGLESRCDEHDERSRAAMKTCTCGEPVLSARSGIICHDNRCSRVHFHMKCVKLKHRPESWRCDECCARGALDEEVYQPV
ncbi:hypothetical protein Q7P37_010635 [Cladosporium fusiforme]